MNNLLAQIHKGMTVYDQSHNEIGTVEYVQFGDEDPLKPGSQAATPSRTGNRGDWLVESIADIFAPDDLPDVLRERLLLYGFVRLNAPGLLNADRYILPNQIQSVDGKKVTLNVSRSELIHRP